MKILILVFVAASVSVVKAQSDAPATDSPVDQTTKATTENAPGVVAAVTTTTPKPRRMPCECVDGICKCCTGNVLSNFNFKPRNRACVNIAYEPDEFEFQYKVFFNDRLLYQNKFSGKNPPPVCLPLRRFIPATMCVRFSNVYMVGRNFHACLNLEAVWNDTELFSVSFDCFRIGNNGVALVKPEDGGGIPIPLTEKPVKPQDLDYNDSA